MSIEIEWWRHFLYLPTLNAHQQCDEIDDTSKRDYLSKNKLLKTCSHLIMKLPYRKIHWNTKKGNPCNKWDRKPYWWNLSFAEICAKLDYRNGCDGLKKQFYLLKKSISEINNSTGATDNSITKTIDLLRNHIEFLLQEACLKTS